MGTARFPAGSGRKELDLVARYLQICYTFNMYSYANFLGALNFSRQYRKEKIQRTAKKEME